MDVLLRRERWTVNGNRVYRMYRAGGLSLRRKKATRRAVFAGAARLVGGALLVTAPLVRPAPAESTPPYLPPAEVDAQALIGPPAARGTAAFEQQMAIVLWLQKTRTPEQVAFVKRALDAQRFAPILGDDLLRVDGLELTSTLAAVMREVTARFEALKSVYDLPRPFEVSDEVRPVGDARPVASYPSGHAIRAIVYGRLLSHLFPQHESALMALARQIGYGRVTAGVHYPMDVVAGQKLGDAWADVILRQPVFRQAVERIRDPKR